MMIGMQIERTIRDATYIALVSAVALSITGCSSENGEDSASERRYINGVFAPPPNPERLEKLYANARQDSIYVDVIKETRTGWNGLDIDAALDGMTDDSQLINITDEGIEIMTDGKAEMRENMSKSFTGGKTSTGGAWIAEKSGGETWGIYKNIKVSYHYSTFRNDDGTEWTRPMIIVAEHKDGKRWREWRFPAVDR